MKFKHVFVIGAGGIGSNLMEPLARVLAYHPDGTKNMTIVDGDVYEEKNQIRQLFDAEYVGSNKAEALATRIKEVCGFANYSTPSYPKHASTKIANCHSGDLEVSMLLCRKSDDLSQWRILVL